MTRLFVFMGKLALFIAGMALLTVIGLFVTGAYLASWPLTRKSPRNERITSLMALAVAGMTLARAYGLDKLAARPGPATDAPEVTELPYHRCPACGLVVGHLPDGNTGLHVPGCPKSDRNATHSLATFVCPARVGAGDRYCSCTRLDCREGIDCAIIHNAGLEPRDRPHTLDDDPQA